MSSQDQRQDRNNDRTNRGRGKPRGGFSTRGRGGGSGHQKHSSMGYNNQYATHNMYAAPTQGFYGVMPPNYTYTAQGPQQQYSGVPFVPIPRDEYQKAPVSQEPRAPLLKKAESNQIALKLKAKFAARLAEEDEKKSEIKPKPEAKSELKEEAKQQAPQPEKKYEPKPEAAAKPESQEPKTESENKAAAKLQAMIAKKLAEKKKEEAAKEALQAEKAKLEESKTEPKVESTAESKVEPPKEEPKVPEPTVAHSNSEPNFELKEENERVPEPQEAEAIPESNKPKVDDEEVAPASDSKESDTTELADSVSNLKIDSSEEQAAGESAVPEEPEDESFSEQVKVSSKIASPKGQSYPEGITATPFDGFVYDITFLKQFQTVVPAINRRALREIVNVEAQKGSRIMSNRGNRMGSQREGRNMSRHPSMASVHGKGRNNSRRKGDRQGSSRRDKDEPAAPVKPLVRGENAYVPRSLKVSDSGKVEAAAVDDTPKFDLLPTEEVERRVKSLLNKMSLDNLDRIATKIIDIANQSKHEDDARTLQQIIGLTFDKACDEPHWSSMYAQFCIKLHGIDSEITDVNTVGKDGVPVSGQHLFRRFMLSRCQKEFEQGWSSTQDEAAGDATDVMSDAYYAAVKAKRHGLGLVRFVGELFKNSFLQVKIINFCIGRLAKETPTEEIVESMCKLITTVAPRLQLESPGSLNEALDALKAWRSTAGFPSRLRFMIMDVEDAHRNGWKVEDEGPKTLAEVHKEVAEEQAAAESEKRSKGGAYGGTNRRNERESQRRLEKERNKVSSAFGPSRRNHAADASVTSNASSSNLKKEPAQKNMYNAFSELS